LRQARLDIEIYRESRRLRQERIRKSGLKELPFIQQSELSDDKQNAAQDGPVNQPSDDKQ